jgi:hypothetical protein
LSIWRATANGKEGEKIIDLTKQIRDHHDCQTKIDIADAKYDNTDNYTFRDLQVTLFFSSDFFFLFVQICS